MKYDHLILDKLLQRYEKSTHYRQTSASGRRVLLRLGPDSRDLPEYDIENPEVRQIINHTVKQLGDAGLIGFEWVRYQQENVLKAVWLLLDQVGAAYAWIGRTPGAEIAQETLYQIKELLDSMAEPTATDLPAAQNRIWVRPALLDMQSRIAATLKLSPLLPDDSNLAGDLLKTLGRMTQGDFSDVSMRVFSSKYFQDSKYMEKNLRSRLVSLIRRYHPQLADQENDEFLSDDDVLRLSGIYRNPEIFEFCGPLQLTFRNSEQERATIDFSIFTAGASLRSSHVDNLLVIDTSRVRRLLFIENRTNYEAYIQKERQSDELAVFHGGFHGLIKQKFLRLIAASLPEWVPIEHWGDIDLGGMRIFLQIRQNIAPRLLPWRMDRQTLLDHRSQAISFSHEYRKKLEKAIVDPAFADFQDLLSALLELGLRLEQEALI